MRKSTIIAIVFVAIVSLILSANFTTMLEYALCLIADMTIVLLVMAFNYIQSI